MPDKAATYNNDSHVRKIILESVEMMGIAFPKNKFEPWPWVHSSQHVYHPMTLWTGESSNNFDWVLQHSYALCNEFAFRFDKTQQHKCRSYLDWIANNVGILTFDREGFTEPPRCFGLYRETIETSDDFVFDYRQYYMKAKRHLAKWTKRGEPEWWK